MELIMMIVAIATIIVKITASNKQQNAGMEADKRVAMYKASNQTYQPCFQPQPSRPLYREDWNPRIYKKEETETDPGKTWGEWIIKNQEFFTKLLMDNATSVIPAQMLEGVDVERLTNFLLQQEEVEMVSVNEDGSIDVLKKGGTV